jgi:hypothetical protein
VFYAAGAEVFALFPVGPAAKIQTDGTPIGLQVNLEGQVVALQNLDAVLIADPQTSKLTGDLGIVAGNQTLRLTAGGNAVVGAQPVSAGSQSHTFFSTISTATHDKQQVSSAANGPFAVNANGTLAYVLSGAPQGTPYTLNVVSLTTGKIVSSSPLSMFANGGSPYIAIAPDNSALYIGADMLFCKLTLPTGNVAGCAMDGNYPPLSGRALAVSGDGSKIYAADGANGLYEYDSGTLQVTRNLADTTAGEGLSGTAVILSSATNSVYESYSTRNPEGSTQYYVQRVALDSFTVAATYQEPLAPADFAVSPDGNELLVVGGKGTQELDGHSLIFVQTIPSGVIQSVVVASN